MPLPWSPWRFTSKITMTPAELLQALETCPILETNLQTAAAELLSLRSSGLPRNLAVTIILHCPPETIGTLARQARFSVVRPGA